MRRSLRLRAVLATAAIVPLALTVTACAGGDLSADAAGADGDTVVVDSAYGEVTIPVEPERVAAISYDTPWQVMSLDVPVVASIDYTPWIDSYTADQQEFIGEAESVGSYGELNYEALAATEPDIILGDAYEVDEATYTRLSEIAPTVIVGGGERGDWQSITEEIATALGRHDNWQEAKDSYEARRDEVKEQYADVISGNTWANFSLGDEAGQFSIQLPTGSTGNLIVNEMGLTYGSGIPLDDEEGFGYASFALEQVGTILDGVTVGLTFSNPDGTMMPAIQEVIDSSLFQELEIAKNDRVYGLATSVTDYPSAEAWIDELTIEVLEPLSK
ncbi:ABC transporter substrate-binding protein [Microbacterium sp. EST19A]|uniref:ABC transporter substrate-binding protein n=1 Tax=Microbacterium sp. EST19A TaxID=2862681 RepID=UPI001CBBA945|nr:ABC transporter substrate-binding protein [Microbacterium sp. EST19A]